MNTITVRLVRNAARLSYILGVASLIVGLLLSMTYHPVSAQGSGNCGEGFVAKDESLPFTYTGSQIITSLYVKAGSQVQGDSACTLFTQDGSNGCYSVTGLGTTSVTVSNVSGGPTCKSISHVEFYSNPQDPTATPVTPVPPTNTPETPVPPTNTPVTPEVPTATPVTPVPPTATPETPVPPTATPVTPAPEDPTATPTTPVPYEPTATGTSVPGITPEAPTQTPQNPTSTSPAPVDPTATIPPQETVAPTLPPPAPQTTRTSQAPALIPVTGGDFSSRVPQTAAAHEIFVNLGIGFLGLGLVLTGITNKIKK